jgi:hypothetical protein
MKTLSVIALLIGTITAFAQSSEREITSQIKEVTVFLQGAQVTRTTTVELKPGQSTLVLSGTSPKILENSIQAEANQGVKVLGATFRINYLEDMSRSEESIALSKEQERLKDLIDNDNSELLIYSEEEQMLKANKVIGGQQTGVNVNELKSAVEYYRQRLMDIRDHKQQIRTRIEEYGRNLARVQSQLSVVSSPKPRPEGEIVVKVESKSDVRIQLKVSYLVQEASWFPLYDIRANNIQSPIAITYKANITQQSGEHWENVTLTVSSANPTVTGARPVIQAWYLGFNNHVGSRTSTLYPEQELYGKVTGVASSNNTVRGRISDSDGSPMPGVNVVVKGSTMGTVTDTNGEYSMTMLNDQRQGTLVFSFIGYISQEVQVVGQSVINVILAPDVAQLSEVVMVGYATKTEDNGDYRNYRQPKIRQTIAATPVVRSTNLEFTIDHLYTIRSEGENQVVDMIEYEVDAQYQYYCAPKLDLDAFLTARLTDWDEYNFLEGQASLFFEGKYIGKTILDTRNTSDTLTLSLGRDRNVVVTREKVKEYSTSQFVGSNRKSLFAYGISVRNKKAYAIDIRIEDQLPVPTTKEITVDEIEDTNAIKDEESGVLTWNLRIQPGKTEKIDLKYEIKYPRYQNIILE